MSTLISVVLPVFRTGPFIAELHERLVTALEGEDRQLVFVDDGSPDGAASDLRALAKRDRSVEVVSFVVNQGQQQAIRAGLRAAAGALVVVMDADLQDPPEAIPALLARARSNGAEAVFATRRNRYDGYRRTISGRAFKWALRRIVPVPVGAGSFMVLRRELVDRLLSRDAPRPYLVAMVGAAAQSIDAIDVPRTHRSLGRSGWTAGMRLRTAVAALYDALTTRRMTWS